MRGESAEAIGRRMFDHTTLGGLQGPTVAPVVAREHLRAEGDWYAVNIVVRKERLFEAVGELRAIGGSGVVVVPCVYIFEEEPEPVFYTHLRAHETVLDLLSRFSL